MSNHMIVDVASELSVDEFADELFDEAIDLAPQRQKPEWCTCGSCAKICI